MASAAAPAIRRPFLAASAFLVGDVATSASQTMLLDSSTASATPCAATRSWTSNKFGCIAGFWGLLINHRRLLLDRNAPLVDASVAYAPMRLLPTDTN